MSGATSADGREVNGRAETGNVDARLVLRAGAGLVAFLIASLVLLAMLFLQFAPEHRSAPPEASRYKPRSEVENVARDRRKPSTKPHAHGREPRHWDTPIPIEEAMTRIVQRGSQAYAPLHPPPSSERGEATGKP